MEKAENIDLVWLLNTGDLEEVKAKLVTAEDVNRTLDNGRKPLHIVADYGHQDVMEFLISTGADVNATDKHGLTPLICASLENHIACVKLLLEKGADKHITMPDGRNALQCAEKADIKALLQ